MDRRYLDFRSIHISAKIIKKFIYERDALHGKYILPKLLKNTTRLIKPNLLNILHHF